MIKNRELEMSGDEQTRSEEINRVGMKNTGRTYRVETNNQGGKEQQG